jgi:hypothetical protein
LRNGYDEIGSRELLADHPGIISDDGVNAVELFSDNRRIARDFRAPLLSLARVKGLHDRLGVRLHLIGESVHLAPDITRLPRRVAKQRRTGLLAIEIGEDTDGIGEDEVAVQQGRHGAAWG